MKKWINMVKLLSLIGALSFVYYYFDDKSDERNKSYQIYKNEMSDTNKISILSANVGNFNLKCTKYLSKLCCCDVKDRIRENIKALNPDIIILQEVLAPWQCDSIIEMDKGKVCYCQKDISQARELISENYTIVCSERFQFECIAIKNGIGKIKGSEVGSLTNTARTTYLNNECDDGFTISAATIELENGFSFDIVNMHPNSINENCRTETILKAFEDTGYSKIINSKYILVAGDFNLDPWRQNGKSVAAWKQIFNKGWSSKNFIYHNPFSSDSLPIKTLYIPLRRTYDYVLSNFCEGVLDVLGETRNTKRLDGGSGCDHRALFGYLKFNYSK